MRRHKSTAIIASVAGLCLAGCSSPVDSPPTDSPPAESPPAESSTTGPQNTDELSLHPGSKPCSGLAVEEIGSVETPGLSEASGLAASMSNPDLIWATNDSGNASGLFALELDGTDRGFFALVDEAGSPVDTVDVEDLAMNAGVLYIADIGDNNGVRDSVAVLMVEEPALGEVDDSQAGQQVTVGQVIELRYPGGPRDAEALLIDPISGDLVILDKDLQDSATRVFVASPPFSSEESIELVEAGSFDLSSFSSTGSASVAAMLFPAAVTASDITSSGLVIGIRTYGTVWLFERQMADGVAQSISEALQGEPCEGASAPEPQGETLVFMAPELEDASASVVRYLTISEGAFRPIYLVAG